MPQAIMPPVEVPDMRSKNLANGFIQAFFEFCEDGAGNDSADSAAVHGKDFKCWFAHFHFTFCTRCKIVHAKILDVFEGKF